MEYDFSGWATKNDLRCSDGRIIRHNAFKDNHGKTVPLVWNHQHNESNNVLGHALLENREDGVYAYGTFNDTEAGQNAKLLVQHGDITSLSIYANQLKQMGGDVIHGAIREVSLVLSGANPGACIENVISHGEESEEQAVIYTGENLVLQHSNEPIKEDKKVEDDADEKTNNKDKTVKDVFNTLNEEQKTVVYALVGQVMEDVKKTSEGGKEEMKHNAFENNDNGQDQGNFLMHANIDEIISDAKRYGSLKDSVLAHAEAYGVTGIEDVLFPDAKAVKETPDWVKRDTGWVSKVMNSTHHTPFSRIKSMYADITADEARAKGYIKGKKKIEEVFSVLKRTTTPTTIYKKQKMDRDDVIDITGFDVIAWIKGEMRMMLEEEIARAILIGDGRLASSDDKINETNIRPVATDDDVYSIKHNIQFAAGLTDMQKAKEFIRQTIKSRKDYKGSGNPTLYTTEDWLTEMLLIEDKNERIIYDTEEKLRTALRVKEIVTVPVMEGYQRKDDDGNVFDVLGIVVNLADYNVGADKGGAISLFDDFDIDYNQQKYLIETRISGALVKPYSAIVLETAASASAQG